MAMTDTFQYAGGSPGAVPRRPKPRRTPLEQDELTSSVFQQPGMQYPGGGSGRTLNDMAVRTNTANPFASTQRQPARRAAAPQTSTQPAGGGGAQAPQGNFDFSTLVSQPQTMGARASAPPLQDTTNAGGAPPQGADPFAAMGGGVWLPGTQQWVPRDHPLAQSPGAQPQPGGGGGPQGDPRFSWMQSQPYQPGEVGMDDMPGFSWESLLLAMGPDYTPTNVQGGNLQIGDISPEDYATLDLSGLPGYEVGATEGLTDDLIARILQNPESLDARTIDMMKAASREEQSALAGQAEDEMRGLGFEMGIADSPWMAAERLQGRRDRDAAVIGGNRAIDIEAAKTNAGDRRAAATLGASYVDSKGRLKLAQRQQGVSERQAETQSKQARAEYLTGVKSANADRALEVAKVRMQADLANNENLFKAASLRKDKVLGTVDADLKRAAATTDRIALREQVAQAAADLGISRDKLMSDWLKALMDDATQRYGIDVAKDVDMRKLEQAGGEFQQDLAFRIMALDKEMGYKYATLGESGRQFDYGYGLSAAELQERARQHDDDFYARSQGF